MKVLVCGGRAFDDWHLLNTTLQEQVNPWEGEKIIIEGGAIGADFLSRAWAKYMHIPFEEYKADWKKDGKSAGAIRNQRMLDEGKPDLVIAFPGGKGTADMVSRATKAGISVREIK